jgi:hypothetical protein
MPSQRVDDRRRERAQPLGRLGARDVATLFARENS